MTTSTDGALSLVLMSLHAAIDLWTGARSRFRDDAQSWLIVSYRDSSCSNRVQRWKRVWRTVTYRSRIDLGRNQNDLSTLGVGFYRLFIVTTVAFWCGLCTSMHDLCFQNHIACIFVDRVRSNAKLFATTFLAGYNACGGLRRAIRGVFSRTAENKDMTIE